MILALATIGFITRPRQVELDLLTLGGMLLVELGRCFNDRFHANRTEGVQNRFHYRLFDDHATEDAAILFADLFVLRSSAEIVHDALT